MTTIKKILTTPRGRLPKIGLFSTTALSKSHRKNDKTTTQNGNVLFIILIAVVMLGLLTMVLSRSGSNVEQSGSFEQLSVQTSQILRYASSLEAAVQNMQGQGISENDISFENTVSTTDYTNPNCDDASDRSFPSCLVFDARGAGLNYKTPDTKWLDSANNAEDYYGDWLFTGGTCIPKIGDNPMVACSAATGTHELLMILPYINLNLCQQINRITGISVTTGNPPQDSVGAWTDGSAEFVGVFGTTPRTLSEATNTDISGTTSGCFEGNTGGPPADTYHFYHVLKAR